MSALVPNRPPSILDVFAQMDADANRKDPGRPARLAEAKRQKEIERERRRAEILERYGSEEAALVGTPAEQRLAAALAKFRRKVMYQFSNGKFPTDSLDGWKGHLLGQEKVPHHVRKAVENATPLPTTIVEAAEEYAFWQERDEELALIHRFHDGDTLLPLECRLREQIVRDLLEHGLRATSMQDVIARQRYAVEMGRDGLADGLDAAVLADLEHLAEMGAVP